MPTDVEMLVGLIVAVWAIGMAALMVAMALGRPKSPLTMSHNLTLLATSRYGCWAICSCGWRSRTYREKMGAQLEFGQHLVSPLRLP